MAISFSNGGARGRRGSHQPPLSEINVTPFVDVVLVLLIIFMLTAHVMEYGMEVDVPKTKTTQTSTKELPVVTITKTGAIYLNRDEVNYNRLADTIRERFNSPSAVYVRADRETPFDPIAQVISVLGEAKLPVSLVTQPDDTSPGSRRH